MKEDDIDAFPRQDFYEVRGMTLRDYFAAKAMQSLIQKDDIGWSIISKYAYAMADKMLKERNK